MKGRKPSSIVTGATPVREIPKPPTWLSKDAKAEFRRAIPSLIERRTLDTADMGTFENYCITQGIVRQLTRQLATSGVLDPPLLRALNAGVTTARQLAAELGLTPVSRSRPTIRDGADDDDADLFGDD